MKWISNITCAVLLSFFSYNAAAQVDPVIQKFLDQQSAGKGNTLDQWPPQDGRKMLDKLQNSVKINLSGVDVQKKIITVDGKPLSLVIVRPHAVKKTLPVFMFLHGGGWVLGNYDAYQRLVRDLVVASGDVAVFVDYSLSPEVHYPVALNQIYGATLWVSQHGRDINVDGKRLAVVGDSAGGNLAAAVALMAKNKGTPQLKFQALLCPVTGDDVNNASYKQFEVDYSLTKNMMVWFWNNYIPDVKDRQQIYASPVLATPAELQGLPPALVQTAEYDVLRDEGEDYAAKMNAAGVPVVRVRYNGMIHDFAFLNVFQDLPSTRDAISQVGTELKSHLGKG